MQDRGDATVYFLRVCDPPQAQPQIDGQIGHRAEVILQIRRPVCLPPALLFIPRSGNPQAGGALDGAGAVKTGEVGKAHHPAGPDVLRHIAAVAFHIAAYSNRVAAAVENQIVREIEGIVDKAVRLLKAAADLAGDAHASANAEVHQWTAGENAEARIEFRNVFESDVDVAREASSEVIDDGVAHE